MECCRCNDTASIQIGLLGGGTCPAAILSTTNSTRTGNGLKPGLHGERLVINHLSQDTATQIHKEMHVVLHTKCPISTKTGTC